ncbi:hypothetical protein SESBI_33248 [Sesbania bispinosa]|nr:hypothetical protein SESBI_33248 [Sesbania bispinosa]
MHSCPRDSCPHEASLCEAVLRSSTQIIIINNFNHRPPSVAPLLLTPSFPSGGALLKKREGSTTPFLRFYSRCSAVGEVQTRHRGGTVAGNPSQPPCGRHQLIARPVQRPPPKPRTQLFCIG